MSYPQTAFCCWAGFFYRHFFSQENWQSLASLILFATNGQLQDRNVVVDTILV
jgi:hypothetical protein